MPLRRHVASKLSFSMYLSAMRLMLSCLVVGEEIRQNAPYNLLFALHFYTRFCWHGIDATCSIYGRYLILERCLRESRLNLYWSHWISREVKETVTYEGDVVLLCFLYAHSLSSTHEITLITYFFTDFPVDQNSKFFLHNILSWITLEIFVLGELFTPYDYRDFLQIIIFLRLLTYIPCCVIFLTVCHPFDFLISDYSSLRTCPPPQPNLCLLHARCFPFSDSLTTLAATLVKM